MAGFENAIGVCPPVVVYGIDERETAAREVEGLSGESVIVGMLGDYSVLREQARACSENQ